jgi:hypothetical protein
MKRETLAVRALVLLLGLMTSISCIGTSRSELIGTAVAETVAAVPAVQTARATPTVPPAREVALVSFHGRYVTAMGADDDWALQQQPTLDTCGVFDQVDLGDGEVALETCHGRYVTAPRRGTTRWDWALWQDSALGDCARFVPHELEGGEVAFESCAGRFLTAGDGGWASGLQWMVVAETDKIQDWERFTLVQP